MATVKFDAKGMACPLPVIETKKLLNENDIVETTVDNFTATQNLEKLATQLGHKINVEKISDVEYIVTISKKSCCSGEKSETAVNEEENSCCSGKKDSSCSSSNDNDDADKEKKVCKNSYIVVINKKIMGHGSEELGGKLIKGFLVALSEQEKLPEKIIFYNEGALLVEKGKSPVLTELKQLEDSGVEIVCCGACKDYYGIELGVGSTTNMYFIVEDMRKANKVVRP